MRRKVYWSCGVAAVLAIALVAASQNADVRWRMQAVWLVGTGQIPDLSLRQVVGMVRPGTGYWLAGLADTRNAYATISNPLGEEYDKAQARQEFIENCAACHGADARGRETGPALVGRSLTHGDSDWAMFRIISSGVAGTSMPPHAWPDRRIWLVQAHVRALQRIEPTNGSAPVSATAGLKVPYSEIAAVANPTDDWLTYSGDYRGQRHSALKQVSRSTVKRLAPRWIHQFGPGERVQTNPIAKQGVLFITHAGHVTALAGATGEQLWDFYRENPPDSLSCCGNTNRGVAVLDDKVYVGTMDAHVVALRVADGKKLWDVPVSTDYAAGYSITSPPLAYAGLVVTGVGGGDYPNRGFIIALDAQTGQKRWQFDTIPGPGQFGHDTWPGDTWERGGGATWVTGSYVPDKDILLWGVGNAAPNHDAAIRRGDNLYTNSVVALRGATGERLWHFQFTPNDDHDWDAAQTPVVVGDEVLWANRNAFYYRLGLADGKFLLGKPFVQQTWARGLDASGRPLLNPGVAPTPKGTVVFPSVVGATNWWPASYDDGAGLLFIPSLEFGGIYYSLEKYSARRRELYLGGGTAGAPGESHHRGVTAVNARTGEVAWRYRRPAGSSPDLHLAGLMSTSGGLVFASDDQEFYALDSRTGELLWSFKAGARIASSPVTYVADGVQYVVISSGRALIAFALVDN